MSVTAVEKGCVVQFDPQTCQLRGSFEEVAEHDDKDPPMVTLVRDPHVVQNGVRRPCALWVRRVGSDWVRVARYGEPGSCVAMSLPFAGRWELSVAPQPDMGPAVPMLVLLFEVETP